MASAAKRIPPALVVRACLPSVRSWQMCLRAAVPAARRAPLSRRNYSAVPGEAQSTSKAPKIERGKSKLYSNADEAVADLQSGSMILSAGFGLCGIAGKSPCSAQHVCQSH
jgi:3-oxoacid CoA-transferase